jgi:hypothetical protein
MLWKALHERLVTYSSTDTEIDQALDVIKQLYEQGLITFVQRDETRKVLGRSDDRGPTSRQVAGTGYDHRHPEALEPRLDRCAAQPDLIPAAACQSALKCQRSGPSSGAPGALKSDA